MSTTVLIFKCGEHWGQDHVCATAVQLHLVEELLEIFGLDVVFELTDPNAGYDTAMVISRPALTGGVSHRAFQLQACMQG